MLPRHSLIIQRPQQIDERILLGGDLAHAQAEHAHYRRLVAPIGGRVILVTDYVDPEDRPGVRCPSCRGTGTVMTRMTVIDGCGFPDEDDCMRCWGAGVVPAEAVHPLRPDLATPTAGAL